MLGGVLSASALVLGVMTVPAHAGPAATSAVTGAAAEGDPVWVAKLQRAGTDETGAAIAAHAGTTYVAATSVDLGGSQEHGQPARDVAVTKLDARGHELWSRRDGTGYLDDAVDVVAGDWGALVLSSGAETVSGWDSTAGFSVTRYDAAGNLVWTRWRDDTDTMRGLAVVGDSYYVVGGSHVRRFDVASGALRREHAGAVTEQVHASWTSVAVLGDDLVVLGGSAAGAGDQYVLRRLDGQTLTVEWTQPFDVDQQDYPGDVVVADDRILLSGTSGESFQTDPGEYGLLLAAHAADGARLWRRTFPFGALRGSPALAATPGGPAVFSTGYTIRGDRLGMTLQTFTPDGVLRSESFVGEEYARATGTDVAWDLAAGLRVAGSDEGETFDPATADQDAFVAGLTDTALLVQARLSPRRLVLSPGRTRTSRLRLTNRGTGPAVLAVQGCGHQRGVRLRVRSGGEDVTRAVRRGTWRSESLDRGRTVLLTIRARAKRSASPARTGCLLQISQPGTSAVPFDKYLRIRVLRRGRP